MGGIARVPMDVGVWALPNPHTQEYLARENRRLREDLRQMGILLWAASKTNGGQLRISRLALDQYSPRCRLARFTDPATDEIVFGTND